MDILKKRMRDLREDADIKQGVLASEMNISQSVISAYECGREPPLDVIFKYAEYFDVSVEYLLGLTNERRPTTGGDEKAIDDMQAAAVARGEEAFSRADVGALAAAFVAYYKAGAPAGNAPMECVRAFFPAMDQVLDAAAAQDVPALINACNELARVGLSATDILAAQLGADMDKTDTN